MPPRNTSLEPGIAVSRAATSPPVHDSAVPRRETAATTEIEHELLHGALVPREQVLLERRAKRVASSRRVARRRARRSGRRGSRSPARKSSPPRRRRRRPRLQEPARRPTRSRRRSAARAAPAAPFARVPVASAADSTARGHSRFSSPEGPAVRRRRTSRVQHDPRRRAREPERDRTLRQRRLFGDARREVCVRPAEPLGHHPGDLLDLRSSVRGRRTRRGPLPSRRARSCGRRASVRARRRPGRRRPRYPSRSACSSSSGSSPTMMIRAGSARARAPRGHRTAR